MLDLQDEWDAVVEFWSERGALGKVLIASGFLCSFFSIASIGESAVGFRGFIVDAIEFYRELLFPLYGWLATLLSISIPVWVADTVVGLCAMFSIASRVPDRSFFLRKRAIAGRLLLVGISAYVVSKTLQATGLKFNAQVLIVIPLVTFFGTVLWDKNFRVTTTAWRRLSLVAAIYLLVAVIASVSNALARTST